MSKGVKNYRDLVAWQKSMNLVGVIYNLTKNFPKEELYGLTSQIRKSAVSVPSNIAEGSAKKSKPDFVRFLNISYGSLAELGTQLEIAKMVGYIDSADEYLNMINEIEKIISGLINSLENKNSNISLLTIHN